MRAAARASPPHPCPLPRGRERKGSARKLRARLQVLLEPLRDGDSRADAIRRLSPAVTFVRKEDVLDRDSALLQAVDDLLGFDDGNVGVVGALEDDGRGGDAVDLVDG